MGFTLHLLIALKQRSVFPLKIFALFVLSRQESRFFKVYAGFLWVLGLHSQSERPRLPQVLWGKSGEGVRAGLDGYRAAGNLLFSQR